MKPEDLRHGNYVYYKNYAYKGYGTITEPPRLDECKIRCRHALNTWPTFFL